MPKAKSKVNVREIVDQIQLNCDRIQEIADLCETENRERTAAETAEYEKLVANNNMLQMRMAAARDEINNAEHVDTDAVLRENLLTKNKKVEVRVMREVTPQTTAALADTGIIPVAEQELLKPIRTGLIYDKVGLTIRSGLVGTLRWPKHGKAVAQWADEAERLTDASIDYSKLAMTGTRLGIAIPVTREELEDSVGLVENIIMSEAPAAVIDAINDALFDTTGKYTDKDGQEKERKVYGPFVEAAKDATEFAGSLPTRKELLKLSVKALKGINPIAPVWVMAPDMEAELRDVKVDAGSGRFLIENGTLLGYPVYTTDAIGEGNIGFGDFSYQAAGFFGQSNFIADPYTLARQNSVDFVLNLRFGTATLRQEAFVLGKVK